MDERLTKLETKLAYQEHTIETLNEVVIGQRDKIDRLEKEIRLLREEVRAGAEADKTDPTRDKPPHY